MKKILLTTLLLLSMPSIAWAQSYDVLIGFVGEPAEKRMRCEHDGPICFIALPIPVRPGEHIDVAVRFAGDKALFQFKYQDRYAWVTRTGKNVLHVPLQSIPMQQSVTLYKPHPMGAASGALRQEPVVLVSENPLAEITIAIE